MSLDVLTAPSPDAPPRRTLRLVVVLLCVLALGSVVWAARSGGNDLPLDPEGAGPGGAGAVVEVLRQQGVQVQVVRDHDELATVGLDAQTMLVATSGPYLGSSDLETLAGRLPDAGRTVLVGLSDEALDRLDLPVEQRSGSSDPLTASCSDPVAAHAPRIGATSRTYAQVPSGGDSEWPDLETTRCYPHGAGAALLTLRGPGLHRLDLLGPDELLRNDTITTQADAALALSLLGSTPRVVWFAPDQPSAQDDGGSTVTPRLAPPWLLPVVLLLLGTVVLTMWWRGRRLGPLAVEPLPVLVHAAESTRARARLYRRAGASGITHSARILQTAAIGRLSRRLRLARDASLDDILTAVAAASSRPRADVEQLLAGPDVTTATALTTLATELDQLEKEIGQP